MTGKNGVNNNNFNYVEKIILIDNSSMIEEIRSFISSSSNVISFDYESHKKLTALKISHEKSDDYLNEEDLVNIQKNVYLFSEWYWQPIAKKYLEYDGINIGRLFHEQTVDFLVQLIKKLYEIIKIFEKKPNTKFIATGILYDMVSSLKIPIEEIPTSSTKQFIFAHDKIRYNLKIGNKFFIFLIPKKWYIRFKQFSELIIYFIFDKTKKFNKNKNILFVEIPTIRYKDLFLNSIKECINIQFYGRRRPAIWNLETYKIIKNSNSHVLTSYSLSDKKTEKKVRVNSELLKSNIQTLFENKSFIDFFCYENIHFWHLIKPKFTQLFYDRISDILFEIELAENLFTNNQIDSVFVLQEIGLTEQIVTNKAKKFGIPIILHQLGTHYPTFDAKIANESQAVYPILADEFIVWGKLYENDAIQNGNVKKSNVISLGAPRLDYLVNEKFEQSDDYVLLATQSPGHMHSFGLSVTKIENYIYTICEICKIIVKQNKKLIVKLHPAYSELDVTSMVHSIDPKILVVSTGDIAPLIPKCIMMIAAGPTTSILEAQILQKPVIFYPIMDYHLGDFKSAQSCVIVDDLKNFKNVFEDLLSSEKSRTKIINLSNDYLKNICINLGSSSKKVLKFLKTL